MVDPEKEEQKKNSGPRRWIGCPVEEAYLGEDRKAARVERKRLLSKDRSKYKKTDQKKHKISRKEEVQSRFGSKDLCRGRVLSITSQGILVESEGQSYTCALRGLLKKEKSHFKNLVTVGDFVLFEKKPDAEGLISDVEERRSVLSRADNLSRRKEQLIAANIDQVIITASVVSPPLKPFLIDRYIIAARKGNMDPVLVINKMDLLDDPSIDEVLRNEQREWVEACKKAYAKAKVPLICLSAATGEGLEQLKKAMAGKASVFSGQSGTGKSSLINFITGLNLAVGKTVQRTKKGSHTTSSAHLLPLEFGGWCVDTPGIKSFGVWDLKAEELQEYFSEIFTRSRQCKFPDCSHTHEAECVVLKDLHKGKISPLRYDSYQTLMAAITEKHRRR